MAKSKLIIENSALFWDSKRRYRVNAVVTHNGFNWQNLTGNNTEPGIGTDWQQTSFNESLTAMESKDFLLAASTASFEIPAGKTAKLAFVNQSAWFPVSVANGAKPYNFSQSGTTVTLKTPQAINAYVIIFYQ